MKIIIVGAGEVGYNIASRLASENKQVVVIEKNPDMARVLFEDLDVQVIAGSGSSPTTLTQAGIQDTDILLAVTDSDEINLTACLVTNLLSPSTKKLARIRNTDFEAYHDIFKNQIPYIDTIINPEIEVVKTIRRLVDIPQALDTGEFADGKVRYTGIRIHAASVMAGVCLKDFPERFGKDRPLIAAIIRKDEVIVPRGDDTIFPGDLVYFVSHSDQLTETLKIFGIQIKPIQSALIVGGGRIGARLACQMEKEGIKTRLIEASKARCLELAEQMDKTVVLHGDGSDQKLFLEENLNQIDAVISVTDDDETNVLVSLLAKNLGVENTVTRIGKSGYYPFLATIGIEKVVSPRLSAVSAILQNVRQGKVLSDISIFGERGEFIQAVALETSDITNRPLKDIDVPKGALLVCILRNGNIIIPTGDSVVTPGDQIIVFAVKQAIKKMEKLLTVKLEFF
ncbi:MAG TPA: Trk system potassium transporter TrkA [Desulfotignum sp.]|nr:Trk system potassium transporter TrkA [Desulfotignum sp.]